MIGEDNNNSGSARAAIRRQRVGAVGELSSFISATSLYPSHTMSNQNCSRDVEKSSFQGPGM